MEFWEWITQKYVEWRGDAVGRERTITEFAAYIGVSQQLMSSWMKRNGKTPRSKKTIAKLVNKYPEVYEILGFPQPPKTLTPYDQLPSEMRGRLDAALVEINALYTERMLKPEDEEALSVAESILKKYGFTVTDVERSD